MPEIETSEDMEAIQRDVDYGAMMVEDLHKNAEAANVDPVGVMICLFVDAVHILTSVGFTDQELIKEIAHHSHNQHSRS